MLSYHHQLSACVCFSAPIIQHTQHSKPNDTQDSLWHRMLILNLNADAMNKALNYPLLPNNKLNNISHFLPTARNVSDTTADVQFSLSPYPVLPFRSTWEGRRLRVSEHFASVCLFTSCLGWTGSVLVWRTLASLCLHVRHQTALETIQRCQLSGAICAPGCKSLLHYTPLFARSNMFVCVTVCQFISNCLCHCLWPRTST